MHVMITFLCGYIVQGKNTRELFETIALPVLLCATSAYSSIAIAEWVFQVIPGMCLSGVKG